MYYAPYFLLTWHRRLDQENKGWRGQLNKQLWENRANSYTVLVKGLDTEPAAFTNRSQLLSPSLTQGGASDDPGLSLTVLVNHVDSKIETIT